MSTIDINVIIPPISVVVGAVLGMIKPSLDLKKLEKKLEKIEQENEKLRELSRMPPQTLNQNGFYEDAEGRAFCPVCRDKVTSDRIPLSPSKHAASWASYYCPGCGKFFEKGTPPPPARGKGWDPLEWGHSG